MQNHLPDSLRWSGVPMPTQMNSIRWEARSWGGGGGGGGVCGFEHPGPSENRLSNLYLSLFYGRPNLNPLTTQIKSQMVSPIATSNDVF